MSKVVKTGFGLMIGGCSIIVGSAFHLFSNTLHVERAYNEALDRASDVSRGPYSREVNEGEYLKRIYNEPGFLDERMREFVKYREGNIQNEEINEGVESLGKDYERSQKILFGTLLTGFLMSFSGCIIGLAGYGGDD